MRCRGRSIRLGGRKRLKVRQGDERQLATCFTVDEYLLGYLDEVSHHSIIVSQTHSIIDS
jgi:hypothetical protein